jgi:uncharacterized Zn finger protein (UPF0148 family)
MSDFDKEAEREKLREKFSKDEQKRERTSRMSELLLKGATMTNKHHDCGSPVFRWQGEEFCPTCQGAPNGEGVAAVEAEEGAEVGDAAPAEAADPVEVGTPDEPAGNGTDETVETAEAPGRQAPERQARSQPTRTAPTPDPTPASPPAQSQDVSTGDGSLAEARASLTRTLTSLSKRAEATDDVSKQRDLLAAATEAAEALEATKRAER